MKVVENNANVRCRTGNMQELTCICGANRANVTGSFLYRTDQSRQKQEQLQFNVKSLRTQYDQSPDGVG